VAAIGRGAHIESLAIKLGADLYIDSNVKKPAEALQELGGARAIIATAPSPRAMTELIGGLGPKGKLILIGVGSGTIEFAPTQLIRGRKTIEGWAGVTPADSDDALRFAELRGVRAMIETYPLEKAPEAYARMMSGDAEFRVVLTM
jgi:D-arabinose 1-dehydrogenase-like Zn-dependent alcohol dehydrogenase